MSTTHEWHEDDDIAGPLDFSLIVYDDGHGLLSINGQAHLPMSPASVEVALRARDQKQAADRNLPH